MRHGADVGRQAVEGLAELLAREGRGGAQALDLGAARLFQHSAVRSGLLGRGHRLVGEARQLLAHLLGAAADLRGQGLGVGGEFALRRLGRLDHGLGLVARGLGRLVDPAGSWVICSRKRPIDCSTWSPSRSAWVSTASRTLEPWSRMRSTTAVISLRLPSSTCVMRRALSSRRRFHRRGLVLAGLAEAFALLLHHAGDFGQEAALFRERALDLLAAGARGLGGGVDVAGLGPEQGARAVQRGRGFFGRQAQVGGLAAQRLGDRVDAMLGR